MDLVSSPSLPSPDGCVQVGICFVILLLYGSWYGTCQTVSSGRFSVGALTLERVFMLIVVVLLLGYVSSHWGEFCACAQALLVGEGDFSFTRALTQRYTDSVRAFACSLAAPRGWDC